MTIIRRVAVALVAALAACGGSEDGSIGTTAAGDSDVRAPGSVEVSPADHHDVSGPLRDAAATPAGAPTFKEHKVHPLPQAPATPNGDPALQASVGPLIAVTPGLSFAGVGNGDYGFTPNAAPPDTNGAVGATQYVQWVNESFAVFNKATGAIAAGFPKPGNALWAGFGGGCATNNDGDPLVQYDQVANRWVLSQFSVTTTPYLQCVAVSTTSDATGTYNRYSFSYTNFPDYPKMGVWPDGYYISYNMFNGTTNANVTLSDNRIAGDILAVSFANARFADPNVGRNKPVTVTGISISGTDAANYVLQSTTAMTTADITVNNVHDVAEALTHSQEHYIDFVSNLYVTILRRAADASMLPLAKTASVVTGISSRLYDP